MPPVNAHTLPEEHSPINTYGNIFDNVAPSEDSTWAVPWSDLMMTMFILFAVLFVYASAKRDFIREVREDISLSETVHSRNIDIPEQKPTILRPVHKETYAGFEVDKALSLQSGPNKKMLTEKMHDRHLVAFALDRPILFQHLSADLEPQAVESLQTILPMIRKSNLDVQVLGYTDGLPVHTTAFAGNWELGTARAMSVANWLIHQGEVSPSRITVSSRGSNDPRVPNISRENRIQNRRVEILLTRNRQGR